MIGACGGLRSDVGDLLPSTRDRFRNYIVSGAEHVAVGREFEKVQEPIHRCVVRFHTAIGEDVLYGNATLDEGAGYQQGSMAVQGVFLGTHENDAPLVGCADYPAYAVIEEISSGEAVVQDSSIRVVTGSVGRTSAQLSAKEDVVDASSFQGPT